MNKEDNDEDVNKIDNIGFIYMSKYIIIISPEQPYKELMQECRRTVNTMTWSKNSKPHINR